MARRASASTHEMCLTHSVLFRRHSSVVVRSLTRRPLENVGAIFSCNFVLSFHPCSSRVSQGRVLNFALWMPSLCEGVRLPRSTRRLRRWSATADLVELWHVQRHHARRSGSKTWSSSHRSGRGEVEALQFGRGGSDAARRGGVDVERATCPRPGSLFSVRTSCLHVPSFPVSRCCKEPEFFLID